LDHYNNYVKRSNFAGMSELFAALSSTFKLIISMLQQNRSFRMIM